MANCRVCFDNGQAFDIADRTADLDDGDIVTRFTFADPVFNFIGDVGNDLDGPALVIAFAFFLDDGPVNPARCHIAVLRKAFVR